MLISPVDQRASRVPPTYRLLAAKADVKWNRLEPGSDGPFQRSRHKKTRRRGWFSKSERSEDVPGCPPQALEI